MVERKMNKQGFFDAHCHVFFMTDPAAFIRQTAKANSGVFAVSVTPDEYVAGTAALSRADIIKGRGTACFSMCVTAAGKVFDRATTQKLYDRKAADTATIQEGCDQKAADRVTTQKLCDRKAADTALTSVAGLGLHPWWVASDSQQRALQLAEFDRHLSETCFVGEVGLDFSRRRAATKQAQVEAFDHIARSCAHLSRETSVPRVLSIHCVHAFDDAFSILSSAGCLESCICVFHWFSGSFDQLHLAIDEDCYFSVSERMLSGGKGREYAKVIPQSRLLLETDAPFVRDPELNHPCVECSYSQVEEELENTLHMLASVRKQTEESLLHAINHNASRLLKTANSLPLSKDEIMGN